MSSAILVFLTAVIAILGTALETRKPSTGKLTTGAWLIITLIVVLAGVQFNNDYQRTNMENQQKNAEILGELKRHNEVLRLVYLASQPLQLQRIYFEFELDAENEELKRYIGEAKIKIEKKWHKKINSGFSFSPFKDLAPDEKQYPMVFVLTQNAAFGCSIVSPDSANLSTQMGRSLPIPTFDVTFHVDENKVSISYTDLEPSISSSDLKFSSLIQMHEAKFYISPIVVNNTNLPIIKLTKLELVSKNGATIKSKDYSQKKYPFDSAMVTYTGSLFESAER